ncbi:hypothetical protein Tco_0919037 [Tanacetum coccineum]
MSISLLEKEYPSTAAPIWSYVVPTGRVIATVSIKVPTGRYIVPADLVCRSQAKDNWKTADTVPAGSDVPATSIPAGSINQAAGSSAVPSTPSSSVVEPVHADTPLPPGHSLGSSENSTRFSSPSDHANHISSSSEIEGIHHHPTTGIFSESTYDADFGGSPTNLPPIIAVDPVPTRRVHTVHPISQIVCPDKLNGSLQPIKDDSQDV